VHTEQHHTQDTSIVPLVYSSVLKTFWRIIYTVI